MSAAITAITMPKWGLTMTEGKVVQWLKQPGASFAPGEELLEIETSKITNVVEADAAGTLARIVAPEGTHAADRRAAGGDRAAGHAGGGDRCVRRAVRRGRANRRGERMRRTGGAARAAGSRARRCAVWRWAAATACRCCCCTVSAAISTRWMFNQPALCDGRRTLALELPGHGLSSKDVGAGDAALFTDVIEAALAALEIERAHVVGHSMGGALARRRSRRGSRSASRR